jgi:hypothetical protein
MRKVSEIMQDEQCERTEALRKARLRYPNLYKHYQEV